jgi:hypothetical protein
MKAKSVLLAAMLSVGAVSAATAGELYPLPIQDNVGTPKERAEVVAQMQQAARAGEIVNGEQSFVAAAPATAFSRMQVAAETREAQRLGLIANGELAPRNETATDAQAIQLAGQAALGVNVAGSTDQGKSE